MADFIKNSHCSYCGAKHIEDSKSWVKECNSCKNINFLNPIPVVVAIVPVDDEALLLIKRGTYPVGKWALPGGYLDMYETWQEGVVREVWEEVHIRLDPAKAYLNRIVNGANNHLIIFADFPSISSGDLPPFVQTREVMGVLAAKTIPGEIAFPTHEAVIREFLR